MSTAAPDVPATTEWTRWREIPFCLRLAFGHNVRGPALNPRAPEFFAQMRAEHRMDPL